MRGDRETSDERQREEIGKRHFAPRLEAMEVLKKALSTRSLAPAATKEDPLDASKHLEHITEEQLDDDVTGSSVEAISSFLSSAQVRIQRRMSQHLSMSMCSTALERKREQQQRGRVLE